MSHHADPDVPNATDPTKSTPPEGSTAPDYQGPVPTAHNPIPAEATGDLERRRPDAGAQEGAAAGAIAGTAVAGPVGTVAGAVIGAVAGGAGDAGSDAADRADLHDTEEEPDRG